MSRIADSGQDWFQPGPSCGRGFHIGHTPDGAPQSRTSRLPCPVPQSPMSLIQPYLGQALTNLEGLRRSANVRASCVTQQYKADRRQQQIARPTNLQTGADRKRNACADRHACRAHP